MMVNAHSIIPEIYFNTGKPFITSINFTNKGIYLGHLRNGFQVNILTYPRDKSNKPQVSLRGKK